MLSYQHVFHAGGPADIHKHAVLWALLSHMRQKDKPFAALDLYAGEGLYALARPETQKIGEYRRGVALLWDRPDLSPALESFHDALRGFNGVSLSTYPGSPALMRAALREDDRLILNELHPAAVSALRRWASADGRMAVHQRDAGEAIKGLLPPSPRRGLLLLDPSYEEKDSYAVTAAHVREAHARWPEGTLAIWFPRLADRRDAPLLDGLGTFEVPTLLSVLDFDAAPLADAPARGLRGSGMIVINAPWQFDLAVREIGRGLVAILGQGPHARHDLRWLTPPR